jgi:hypothetical protein
MTAPVPVRYFYASRSEPAAGSALTSQTTRAISGLLAQSRGLNSTNAYNQIWLCSQSVLIVKLTHLIQWLVSFNAGADFAAAFIEKPANGLSPSIRFENRAIVNVL